MKKITQIIFISLILLNAGCQSFFFYPTKEHVIQPRDIGIDAKEIWIDTSDNEKLHSWYLPAVSDAEATLVFAHGNAQNISTHIASVYSMPMAGVNVLIFDYRGYGKSTGTPSIAGLILDLQAVLKFVIENNDMNTAPIFVLGQSLGGSITISSLARFEQKDKISGVIIDSAFTSFRDIAKEKLDSFWLTWPFQWTASMTIDDTYRPIDDIGKLSPIPVLVIHSREDEVIPFLHGNKLFDAAGEPKEFWVSNTHRHNQILADPRNQEILLEFVKSVLQNKK